MNKKLIVVLLALCVVISAAYSRPAPKPASRPITESKRWVALLTQSGTSVPTAVVLENTLSGNVVFYRGGAGVYGLDLDGEFTENKTWVMIGQPIDTDVNNGTPDLIVRWRVLSPNEVQVLTSRQEDFDNPLSLYNGRDGLLNNTPIEIRVFE